MGLVSDKLMYGGEGWRTFFAPPMCFDVVCLLALAMALWDCARELVGVREDDLLACPRLYQAVVYCLCHWAWPWIFALDNVLACRFFERPYYRLRRRGLELLGHRGHAIAVYGDDDKVVLLLRFLGNWEAEDLVHILPRYRKLDTPIRTYCPYATILLVEQFKCELLALRYREANAWVCPPCFVCAVGQAASCCWSAILTTIILFELALLCCWFGGGL